MQRFWVAFASLRVEFNRCSDKSVRIFFRISFGSDVDLLISSKKNEKPGTGSNASIYFAFHGLAFEPATWVLVCVYFSIIF